MPLTPNLTKFTTVSPFIASFDYTDIAEGTGIILENGFVTIDGTNTKYSLNKNILFSAQIEETTAYSVAGFNSYNDVVDKDFDLGEFNKATVLKGTAYVRFTGQVDDSSGAGWAPTWKFQVLVRKWDGSTETEIANVESAETTQAVGTSEETTYIMPITIPRTHFSKGETLRVTIKAKLKSAGNPGTSTGNITFGTDPQNRDGTVIIPSTDSTGNRTTNLKIWIPFEI